MPTFDPATAIMAVLMATWNILIMILKYTLITFLVMLVAAPGSWIEKFFFDIVLILSYLICKLVVAIQINILEIVVNTVIKVMESFPDIVVSDVVTGLSGLFTGLAVSLITGFFIYQLIKNTFSHLGFDGEATLNTLIVYIVVIAMLLFSNNIISVMLQITYDISNLFIQSLGSFNDVLAVQFKGFITNETEPDSKINLATNFLTILILGRIIGSFIDIAFTVVQKMVSISILIIIGPLAISFGVLKSMRTVMTTWVKALFAANFLFVMYAVMLFYVSNTIVSVLPGLPALSASASSADITKLFIVAGLAMSITKIEVIVIEVFFAQPTGGSSGLGIDLPDRMSVHAKTAWAFMNKTMPVGNPLKGGGGRSIYTRK